MSKVKKMKQQLPIEVGQMFDQLSVCLEDWATIVPKPHHDDHVDEWKESMKHYIRSLDSDTQSDLVDSITAGLLEAYTAWTAESSKDIVVSHATQIDHEHTKALMLRPQTAQRTSDWYTEFKRCLTASELHKVFGSPRERGTLVLQKAGVLEIGGRGQKLVSYKEQLTPMDWGVCFEPVVKLILEYKWDAMIHECGRFVHLREPRLAASPDGLILRSKNHPEMAGHLLEIKCPKSRKIGGKIPMDYFYQMQLQMEVTGVRACEYVEVKFDFTTLLEKACQNTNTTTLLEPTSEFYGKIAVVGCFNEETGTWDPCRYEYGTVNDLSWKPNLGLNEQTLQLNTWVTMGIHHERVLRDEGWFGTLWPKLYEFWADVGLAKEGKFVLPESSRKKKDIACEIVDSDSDEIVPTVIPAVIPTVIPAAVPTVIPAVIPTAVPTAVPTVIDPDIKTVLIR